ncbi:MAG: hypothetical protein GX025_11035 [Clostridiales bacterium]|nr:hypothetical protein [Clostridiales bacterium]
MNEFRLAYIIIMLAVPICGAAMLLRWSLHRFGNWLSPLLVWQRVAVLMVIAAVVSYGGSKPLPQPILEILVLMRDGTLKDISGRVASGQQARAIRDFLDQSGAALNVADGVIEQARQDCIALTNQLATADYSVAYISLDLPRGVPTEPNHNIMVSFERVEQSGDQLTAYVWFSEVPATNVNVHVEYSIADGQWRLLAPVSNSFPDTQPVNGIDCYVYEYAIPQSIVGVPLKPQYEIEFGGFAEGQWLSVPESGVVVEVDDISYMPYTGWDEFADGDDLLRVRSVGGIAVEAVYNGIIYKGGLTKTQGGNEGVEI